MKKIKVTMIEWEDSLKSTGAWVFTDEFDYDDKERKMIHYSVGFLIKKTKDSYFLSQSRQGFEYDKEFCVAEPLLIPVSAVKKVKTVNQLSEAKKK